MECLSVLSFMAGLGVAVAGCGGVGPDKGAIGPPVGGLDRPLIHLDVQAAYTSFAQGLVHLRDPIGRP